MPFNSLKYFLFLPLVYLLYYVVGERVRWCVLLAASLLFYAALNVPYLVAVLALVTAITYCFGCWLDKADSPRGRLCVLWAGIVANVVILVVMKYLPFLCENLAAVSALFLHGTDIQPTKGLVAIGVSYYIFHAISYLFDIYLELEKPERHFGYFALYLAFFPKLLQGPIERASTLIPQFKKSYEFNYESMRYGMLLFGWGLFKKLAVADRLGLYVDRVYNDVHAFTGLPLVLATYSYAFQIYMDFSGYTDMALGSALLFGIKLTNNFNNPYLATSVAEFWRRWHITFSRWILDYLFTPLQMQWRRWRNWGTAAALVVAFLISGLWHGASWGFVIWGGLHGLYMASSIFYRPLQKKLHKSLGIQKTLLLRIWQTFVTFNLVCFAWIFFRARSVDDALYVISNALEGIKRSGGGFFSSQGSLSFLSLVVSLAVVATVAWLPTKVKQAVWDNMLTRWTLYYALALSITIFSAKSTTSFIYLGF